MCDRKSALRNATAPLHGQIDALFGAFDLARYDGLTRFLTAQAIGMEACQPHATRFGRHILGRDPPDYSQMLKTDLAVLGIATEGLPRLVLPSAIADAGVFYVVAGSRMGTAVLRARATAQTPRGAAKVACGYFTAGEGPAMWRLFRAWLGDEARTTQANAAVSDLPDMIDAAKATFQLFAEAAQWAAVQPVIGTHPAKGFAA